MSLPLQYVLVLLAVGVYSGTFPKISRETSVHMDHPFVADILSDCELAGQQLRAGDHLVISSPRDVRLVIRLDLDNLGPDHEA